MFKDTYYIMKLDYQTAMDIVVKEHYLHRKCPCSMAFGLVDLRNQEIKGVITYGVPPSSTLLKGVCGEEESRNVYELNRLWLSDDMPRNSESYLIGNTLKMIDREIVVSYADTGQDHIGYVYQATNWIYTGLSAKRTDWKIEGMEHLHNATIGDLGRGKENRAKYLRELYGDKFYLKERSRKHRYVFFSCNRRRKRELIAKLKYKVFPYPKAVCPCEKPSDVL